MVVSELRLLDFFTQQLRLTEVDARSYIRDIVAAEEKFHSDVATNIDKKFEERKAGLATKEDIYNVREEINQVRQEIKALEVRMEQNTKKLLIWLVSVIFAASGLIVALIKLL